MYIIVSFWNVSVIGLYKKNSARTPPPPSQIRSYSLAWTVIFNPNPDYPSDSPSIKNRSASKSVITVRHRGINVNTDRKRLRYTGGDTANTQIGSTHRNQSQPFYWRHRDLDSLQVITWGWLSVYPFSHVTSVYIRCRWCTHPCFCINKDTEAKTLIHFWLWVLF